MWTLVAKGTWDVIGKLATWEPQFAEGDRGQLRIDMRLKLPSQVIDAIDWGIRQAGVKLERRVQQENNTIVIDFRKAVWPLAAIAAVILGVIALWWGSVVGWQLLKFTPERFERTLYVIGALIVIAILLQPKKKKVTYA